MIKFLTALFKCKQCEELETYKQARADEIIRLTNELNAVRQERDELGIAYDSLNRKLRGVQQVADEQKKDIVELRKNKSCHHKKKKGVRK